MSSPAAPPQTKAFSDRPLAEWHTEAQVQVSVSSSLVPQGSAPHRVDCIEVAEPCAVRPHHAVVADALRPTSVRAVRTTRPAGATTRSAPCALNTAAASMATPPFQQPHSTKPPGTPLATTWSNKACTWSNLRWPTCTHERVCREGQGVRGFRRLGFWDSWVRG